MRQKMLALVAAGSLLAAGAAAAAPSSGRDPGPFRLVSLPELGTVVWKCGAEANAYALGFRPAANDSGIRLALYAGGRLRARATLTERPFAARPILARRQRLEIHQFTGAGALRASVSVDFGARAVAAPCFSYLPPRTVVRMGPRR